MASCISFRSILSVIGIGIILILQSKDTTALSLEIEPETATWDQADRICRNDGYTLLPGRRYRAKDIMNLLQDGQTAWLYGWRLVSDVDANTKGRLKTLKVDQSRKSNTGLRYVCKQQTSNIFYYPLPTATTITEARDGCATEGNNLATVDNEDEIRDLLNLVVKDKPHWLESVTTDGSFMKQCLAVQKGRSPEYFYDKCNLEYNFICHKDPKLISNFATMAALKLVRRADIQNVIDEGPTMISSSTEVVPEPTSTLELISSTSSIPFSDMMSATVDFSSSVVPPVTTLDSSSETKTMPTLSSPADLTPSSSTMVEKVVSSSSSSQVSSFSSTPMLVVPTSSITEAISPSSLPSESSSTTLSSSYVMPGISVINTDIIVSETSSDTPPSLPTATHTDSDVYTLPTVVVSDSSQTMSSSIPMVNSVKPSYVIDTSASDNVHTDLHMSSDKMSSSRLSVIDSVSQASLSPTVVMTAMYNQTLETSSIKRSSDMLHPTYQSSSSETLMTGYVTVSSSILQNSSRTGVTDHIQQTISSILQSVKPTLTDAPIMKSTDMPTGTSTTGLNIPSSDPYIIITPSSATAATGSSDTHQTTTKKSVDETLETGGVTDGTTVQSNASDRKAKAPEDDSMDTGLWVAFVILIIAVIVSLIVAFILYRKRKNTKSKDINTNGSASSTVPTPSPTPANDVELRDTRASSKSPPRDSTTFKNSAYDL